MGASCSHQRGYRTNHEMAIAVQMLSGSYNNEAKLQPSRKRNSIEARGTSPPPPCAGFSAPAARQLCPNDGSNHPNSRAAGGACDGAGLGQPDAPSTAAQTQAQAQGPFFTAGIEASALFQPPPDASSPAATPLSAATAALPLHMSQASPRGSLGQPASSPGALQASKPGLLSVLVKAKSPLGPTRKSKGQSEPGQNPAATPGAAGTPGHPSAAGVPASPMRHMGSDRQRRGSFVTVRPNLMTSASSADGKNQPATGLGKKELIQALTAENSRGKTASPALPIQQSSA